MKSAASRPFGQDTAFLVVISNYKEIGKKSDFAKGYIIIHGNHIHHWQARQ
jgi:hypothetical protein